MRFSNAKWVISAGLAALLGFVIAVAAVFRLHAASGEVYAPYSTYRADPQGAMALYEALDALPDTTLERYIRPFDRIPDGQDAALFIAGASLGPDPVEVLENVEAFAMQGGRVVIAFRPLTDRFALNFLLDDLKVRERASKSRDEPDEKPSSDQMDEEPGDEGDSEPPDRSADDQDDTHPEEAPETNHAGDSAAPPDADEAPEDGRAGAKKDEDAKVVDISERWGFSYDFQQAEGGFGAVRAGDRENIEAVLASVSGLYFRGAAPRWDPVYLRPGGSTERPWIVAMEMVLGSGSIVLCSDSYFLSNEALRKHRASGFLAWLAGDRSRILFSEAHLGTQQRDRIMTLVRRYRLHGVLLAAILIGGLFVWKNATALLPRVERAPREAAGSARSHQEGLDNLLVRFIPRGQLLETCMKEWRGHFHGHPRADAVEALHAGLREPGGARETISERYNRLVREMRRRQ
ncbi:MAG: DUF4350 domain-containing protein [Candidatus Hydrogenedentes bacterium]|nr:DUF4350 domain-containing protein [Candidatus Hydrogenedentota bacterium]